MTISESRVRERSETSGATAAPYRCTPGEDLVTALLGATMVGGLLTDAWAHTNIIDTIESFFTPWHAMLYGGFTAIAAWTFWLALRRRARTPRWWRDGWPVGYALGAAGAVGFALGGLLDMVWHSIFGIETSLDITFSPSHLLLSLSAVLLLTSPVRSWWVGRDGGVRAVAGTLSLGLGTLMGGILLTAFSAFASTAPTRVYDHVDYSPSYIATSLGLGSYLITTVVIMVPFLLAHRRRPTPGTATAIVGILSMFVCLMYELPRIQTAAALGAITGAVLTDLAVTRIDGIRGVGARLRLPIAGALFAILVWTGHFAAMHLAGGVRWPVELVTGSVVFGAVIGVVLGCLASPVPQPPERAPGVTGQADAAVSS